MDTTVLSFREYKADYSLYTVEDFFLDESRFGCNETEFEKWLKSQRLFIKRFCQQDVSLIDVQLPANKWGFFTSYYVRVSRTNYLVSTFPEGFFEAEDEDGQVACFLPDTYGEQPFRISYYRSNGPTYHEAFSNRLEALTKLANGSFKPKEGALDALISTEQWNRGLMVTLWLYEGISPYDGLQRDKSNPEVQQLFAAELAA